MFNIDGYESIERQKLRCKREEVMLIKREVVGMNAHMGGWSQKEDNSSTVIGSKEESMGPDVVDV